MDRLSEIRARFEAATPGPWFNFGDWLIHTETDVEHNGIPHEKTVGSVKAQNAAFIAHSRDDIPYLLSRLEKTEAENRWIPAGERLPDVTEYRNGDRYKSMDSNELVPLLVCCKDTEIPFRAFYDGNSWGDGWGKQNVTRWRPLPEPPKGE